MMTWFKRFRLRRKAKEQLHAAQTLYALHRDIKSKELCEEMETQMMALKNARRSGDIERIESTMIALEDACTTFAPPRSAQWFRNNFDMIVSALAVAFCFRAYYYQPFKIPTGSMQPTLYGIHVVESDKPDFAQHQPMRFVKWLITGSTWDEYRVKRTGNIYYNAAQSTIPGYGVFRIGQDFYSVPDAALPTIAQRFPQGTQMRVNQKIWSGYTYTGDFLFVNRWIWNFRHPQRGEVMVFSTNGLEGLMQNQHYIKRMCGVPGDTVSIKTPYLCINHKPITTPQRFEQIATHACAYEGAPPYIGFQPTPTPHAPSPAEYRITSEDSAVKLGERQYYALGDNSANSLDSRYWGRVPAQNLLGPAAFVHWPFTSPRWGTIE